MRGLGAGRVLHMGVDMELNDKQRSLMEALIRLIADDGHAATFQSMGQYRAVLIRSIRGTLDDQPAKCDGTHAGPPCTDPECWNGGKPAPLVRLEQEHAELSERYECLGQYLHSLGFDLQEHAQKQLLLKQHRLQGELLAVLTDRLRLVHRKLNKGKER